ncbi:MAG: NAD(P)H-dependent oxidoreductase [Proteobacteria bacterium]|nr:NAD(P)H-dependent oxidoreductase [Pseudomonadota bacterium]MDE3207663.1 NAD(P)H-dependent oxidoreductase [Pseudomonadota bacterium]
MNVLTLVAHPQPGSFTYALARAFETGVKKAGHSITQVDLYEQKFSALVTGAEMASWKSGYVPEDVRSQQTMLKQANALALIYPVWWGMPPAILVGWLQRVLIQGFAFESGKQRAGLLDIPAQIIATIGSKDRPGERLFESYFSDLLGVFSYCGMHSHPPLACWGLNAATHQSVRNDYINAALTCGENILISNHSKV